MEQKPTEQGGQAPQQQPIVQPPQSPMQPPTGPQPQKSNNKVVLIILAVVVVLGIVALAGGYFVMRNIKSKISEKIGQNIGANIAEKAIEQATGQKADVSADGKTVSIKTGDGTMSTSEEGAIKLPSDFPSDVFTYPDAKITFAISTPANAASGTTASYIVSYSVNQSPHGCGREIQSGNGEKRLDDWNGSQLWSNNDQFRKRKQRGCGGCR